MKTVQKGTGQIRHRQKEARQADILRASITVISKKGYHRTRISDIAKEADVAYGLVYHYFGSKETILTAIFESIWERFGERINRISKNDKPTVAKLTEISDYMLDTCIARPDLIRLLVQEVVRSSHIEQFPDVKIVRRIIGMIETIFLEGMKKKELSADSDARLLSFAFFGAMETVLSAISAGLYGENLNSRELKVLKKKMRLIIGGGSFGVRPEE